MERAQLTTWFFEPLKVGSVGIRTMDATSNTHTGFASNPAVHRDLPTATSPASERAKVDSANLVPQRQSNESSEYVPGKNTARSLQNSSQAPVADQSPNTVPREEAPTDSRDPQFLSATQSRLAPEVNALIGSTFAQQASLGNGNTANLNGHKAYNANTLDAAIPATVVQASIELLPQLGRVQSNVGPSGTATINFSEMVQEEGLPPELEAAAKEAIGRIITSKGSRNALNNEPQVGLYAEKSGGGVGVWIALPASLENMRLQLPTIVAELQRIYASREHPLFKVICNGSVIWERSKEHDVGAPETVVSSSNGIYRTNHEVLPAPDSERPSSNIFISKAT